MSYKILIIEDQLLIAEDISMQLDDLGYEIIGVATNRKETFEQLSKGWPDLIIADVMLDGENGIDIVEEVLKHQPLPVIYLTGNSESATVKKAMKTHPAAYMVKPFKRSEFSINIDLAIHNFQKQQSAGQDIDQDASSKLVTDAIFIPDQHNFIRIKKEEIYMVEADGSYIKIFTKDKMHQLSSNLKNFEFQLNDPSFLRISRKYLINTAHAEKINGNTIYLGPYEAVITKVIRQEMLQKFPILRTRM
jgi:DNA-binding LytR/AlgR family response regulator